MMKFHVLYILLMLLSFSFLNAQEKPAYNKNGIFVDLNLGIGKASGLLSNRFGSHNLIGGGVSYHPASGLDYGVKFHYFFGNSVKEDVLAPYRTDFGQLIGGDGYLTDVTLKERGFYTYAYLGKLLQFDRHSNFKHGLKLSLGLGFLEHKIRIQDDSRSAIQFFGTFGLGLDRLTNGFCTSGFVGYEFKSNNGKINFYSGFESILGFTQNQRAWNYDTAISEAGINRKDLLLQFKIGWYLPFFFERHSETIEY